MSKIHSVYKAACPETNEKGGCMKMCLKAISTYSLVYRAQTLVNIVMN
jgi:hypothetical protein